MVKMPLFTQQWRRGHQKIPFYSLYSQNIWYRYSFKSLHYMCLKHLEAWVRHTCLTYCHFRIMPISPSVLFTIKKKLSRTMKFKTGPRGYRTFFMLTQLSMKFVPLINLKVLTITISVLLNTAEHEIFSANKYENSSYCWHSHIYKQRKIHAKLTWAWKTFIISGQGNSYNLGAYLSL